ncbi:MAG: hypothetical protein R3F14_05020 [Polyangiaceae bacterium]
MGRVGARGARPRQPRSLPGALGDEAGDDAGDISGSLSTALARPEAAPWLVARLAARSDPAPVRRALAEALPFTKGPFAEAVGDLLAAEPSPEVRAELAATLEHAPPGISSGAMRSALLDPDETVRARALYTVASRSDGASYSDMITRALGQPEPGPKAAAIHACGVLRLTVAKPALDALVRGQGDHRAAALLALHRIDPEGARARSDLDALAADPALVHAVARIRGGAP